LRFNPVTRRTVLGSVVLAALILAAAWIWTDPARKRAATNERFEQVECWFGVTFSAKTICGWLTVPERRDAPNGTELRLPVVILKRSDEANSNPPIVFLNGGPGAPNNLDDDDVISGWWDFMALLPYGYDLILFDQRGTGVGEPNLHCPELVHPDNWLGVGQRPGEYVDTLEPMYEAVARCRDRILERGYDLTAFNTRQGAADVDALRRTLGVERVILLGSSYGTEVGLGIMRYHPEGVHSAILDSVSPPQTDSLRDLPVNLHASISRVFADCVADRACAEAYPDLRKSFEQTVLRFAREPAELVLQPPDGSPELYFKLDDVGFIDILFSALYDPRSVSAMPYLIHRAAHGRLLPLQPYAERLYFDPYWTDLAAGMALSVNCHDEAPFTSRQENGSVAELYPLLKNWAEEMWSYDPCRLWPSSQAEAVQNSAVQSDIPTLLLAGAYDPVTPPAFARLAAQTLSDGHVFVFPGAAHSPFFSESCTLDLLLKFLEDPRRRPDSACLLELKPPQFFILNGHEDRAEPY